MYASIAASRDSLPNLALLWPVGGAFLCGGLTWRFPVKQRCFVARLPSEWRGPKTTRHRGAIVADKDKNFIQTSV